MSVDAKIILKCILKNLNERPLTVYLARISDKWRAVVYTVMNLPVFIQ
jgi:hypothetical protein